MVNKYKVARIALLATTCFTSSVALAQEQADDPNTPNEVTTEDIVVTAQRREQNVQDVPISITAASGERLERAGVTNAADLGAIVPNLAIKFATGSSSPVYTIRGIGTSSYTTNTVPSVGVYVDEVYQTNTSMSAFQLFDVERVEVLRGPQGTLFGRNTTGGAVSYFSNRPTNEFEGRVNATLGTNLVLNLGGVLSGPLSDTLSARASVQWNNQYDGFFRNARDNSDYGDAHSIAGRVQFLWKPTSNFEALLRLNAGNEDSDNWFYYAGGVRDPNLSTADPYYTAQNGGFRFASRCAAANAGDRNGIRRGDCVNALGYRDADGDPFTIDPSTLPFVRNRSLGATLTMKADFGWADLTSVTGYQNFRYRRSEDFDASPFQIVDSIYRGDVNQYSQELRLASSSDALSWVVGGFYGYDTLNEADDVNSIDSPDFRTVYNVRYRQTTETYSGFGHAEVRLTPDVSAILAGRVTHDRITYKGGTIDSRAANPAPGGFCADLGLCGGVTTGTLANSYTEWSGKFGLNFNVTDDVLLYASISRGFKSAGFNGGYQLSVGEIGSVRPERLVAYEMGAKVDLFDRALRLNGSTFFYDYTDIQILGVVLPTFDYRLVNLGKAKVWGAELEATIRPGKGWELSGNIAYVDSRIDRGNSDLLADIVGNTLPNAPRFTLRGSIARTFDVSADWSLTLSADVNWQDRVFYSIENNPLVAESAYALVDLRANIANTNSGWEVSAWVKNVANQSYFRESFAAEGSAGLVMYTPGTPRTAGLTVTRRF